MVAREQIQERIDLARGISSYLRELLKSNHLDITYRPKAKSKFHELFSNMSFASFDLELKKLVTHVTDNNPDGDRVLIMIGKISLFYILLILCAEFSFDSTVIVDFWNRLGINEIGGRISYIIRNLGTLVFRGPFALMALTTFHQYKGRFSRGMFFDALHSVYLPYVDLFLVRDKHFIALKEHLAHPCGETITALKLV